VNGQIMSGLAKSAPKAIVIGGSVGGLFAGNILLRRNWQVDVFERAEEPLAARGAGIAHHRELKSIMAAAGAVDDGPLGIAFDARTAFDRFGNEIARFHYPQYLATWRRVFNQLHAAFPPDRYHQGRELIGLVRLGGNIVARFADGASSEADLIIGADGLRSTVRAILAPEILPLYAGYVAWRGLVEEADLSAGFREHTFDKFAFCFPPRGQFIGYPIAGRDESTEPGRRRYNFLWYYHVADTAELADLLTDETGHTHQFSIPPPLIRRSHVEQLKRNAASMLPPLFAEPVVKARRQLLQPIYDVESTRMGFEQVALIGDAAFVARPHVGVGVLKAGQDALALAAALSECSSIDPALARYEAVRLPVGRDTVRLGRHLGSFIQRGLPGPCSDPELNLSPEKIIRLSARSIGELIESGVHTLSGFATQA
jgi:2-polyprenyl-6-methoxyphenol hydroxylase-like FAD-dependent oxidoreductase